MLNLNFVLKSCLMQWKYQGQRVVCRNIIRLSCDHTVYLSRNCNQVIKSELFSKNINKMSYSTLRHISQALLKENVESKSNFQQFMHLRRKQSERSVLFQLTNKEDIPHALAACQKFGVITGAFSYAGESDNSFLLLEFAEEDASKNLLLSCHFKNISDTFPVFSRMLEFEKKSEGAPSSVNIDVISDKYTKITPDKKSNISDLIQNIYLNERLTELNIRLRYFFCTLIRESISGLFPYCEVFPFGSSVNGIGRHGCDLDIMIRLYPEEVSNGGELYFLNKTCVGDIRALQQKTVFCLGDYFRTFFPGVSSVQKIIHARMPILKLRHKILNMDCDVSVNNMSAVMMSEVIHFFGEIDARVRPLLYAIKKWAKDANITYETPGSWITNFGLTTLVIYFLQNRPIPILPALNDAIIILGEEGTAGYKLQYLKSLEELQSCASLNKESLDLLLKEFLMFLVTYSFKDSIISLMTARSQPRDHGTILWIQYPFEEGLNITKNVSDAEFRDLREKAKISCRHLENAQKLTSVRDFNTALGITNLKKHENFKSNRIDIKSLLEDDGKNVKKRAKHRV